MEAIAEFFALGGGYLRNTRLGFAAVVALLSVLGLACAQDQKAEQLASLDSALKAGVISKAEYAAMKARILAATATPAGGNYYRLKQVKVIDQSGFETPIPAMSLLIPSDWQFQGEVQYVGACGLARVAFRATGPDGSSMELLPDYIWQWSDDPATVQFLRTDNQQKAQYGIKGCDVMPPMAVADFLRQVVVPKVEPGARLVAIEPMPTISETLQETARQSEAQAAQAGLRMRVRPEAARARVERSVNGQKVEEWVAAMMLTKMMPRLTFNPQTMRQGEAVYYNCWARLFKLGAPPGKLDPSARLFEMIGSTMRFDPAWQSRIDQVMGNIQAGEIKGAADRAAINRKSAQDINKIIIDGHAANSRITDRAMENYSQATRGVESYRNPTTGETIALSNQYGHAWVNNQNEYILSDQPGFNPNVELKSGNWTALERVKPQ